MNDYVTQSKMTSPGQFSYLYDALPGDIDSLHHVVNNIFIHIWKMKTINVADERKSDFAIRSVEAVLQRAMAYDDSPLTEQRPRSKQFIGDCRHAALLLSSMLRHHGIPARLRQGFCQYISSHADQYMHHVITEYWDGQRWVLEDADIIRHDIPADDFVFGAQAWQQYRDGTIDAEQFYLTEEHNGAWTLPIPMVRDIASLAKYEATSSDLWGLIAADYQITDAEKEILDDAAAMLAQGDTFQAVYSIYQKYPVLKVSQPLVTWDWLSDEMIEVDISQELD